MRDSIKTASSTEPVESKRMLTWVTLSQRYANASLQRKMAIIMGVGGLGVILFIGLTAFLLSRQLIIGNIKATQLLSAQHISREVALALEASASTAQSLANNTVTANALADSFGRVTYLSPLVSAQTFPVTGASLSVTDYRGVVVADSRQRVAGNPVSTTNVVVEALRSEKAQAGITQLPEFSGPVLVVAFPVKYRLTGLVEGAVVLTIPTSGLLPANASAYQLALSAEQDVMIAGGLVRGESIQTKIPVPLLGVLEGLHLDLWLSQSRAEALKALDQMVIILMVVAALLVMAVIVISRLAARFLGQPLTELATTVRRISESGRPEIVPETTRADEFGMLARAFSTMLERLAESYKELERKVEERTRALQSSERKLDSILASLVDSVWSLSPDGARVTYLSQATEPLTGLTPRQITEDLGEFFRRVHPADVAQLKQGIQSMIVEGQAIELEFRFANPQRGERVLMVRARPIRDELGQVIRLDGVLSDVTQRSVAEQRLRSRELYLRAILDNFPFMVWLKDRESRFLAVNQRFAEACGKGDSDLLQGMSDFDVWPAELAAVYRSDDLEVIASGVEKNIEEPCQIGGERRWIETFKRPVVTPEGEVIGTVGFARDISARKKTEEKLVASEERWDLAISGTNDGIWDWNLETGELFLSNRWKAMLGYQPDELPSSFSAWESRIHPEDRPRVMQAVQSHLEGVNDLYQVEHRLRCKTGGYRWILSRGRAVRDQAGKPTRFIGSHTDIQERVDAEHALRVRTAQLNAIFMLSPDGFIAFGKNNTVEYVSNAFTQMTGLSEHEIIGIQEEALVVALRSLCAADSRINQQTLGRLSDDDHDALPHAGRMLLELVVPETRVIELGRRQSSVSNISKIYYFRDVTHETEVDRLKSEFLSTAAHELRTPMVSILGFSELLQSDTEIDTETARELIATIHRQSQLMASIINELLDLARIEARRGQDFEIEAIELNSLISQAIQAFRYPDDERQPILHLCAAPALVLGDRRKVTQALLNVVSNAFKYSAKKGEIRIGLCAESRGGKDGYLIQVSDQGIGMSPESVARVCERFYRADSSGAILGTGLGMSIVKEIVELHGGALDITSQLGKGTSVRMWFALADHREVDQDDRNLEVMVT